MDRLDLLKKRIESFELDDPNLTIGELALLTEGGLAVTTIETDEGLVVVIAGSKDNVVEWLL